MVFYRRLVQVDKKNGVYFLPLNHLSKFIFNFTLSSKTEVGPAGEQPARDILDGRQNVNSVGYHVIAH